MASELAVYNYWVTDLTDCFACYTAGLRLSLLIPLLTCIFPAPAPTVKEIDELAALYSEGNHLAEIEQKMLNEEPSDVIKNIGILKALRQFSETESARPSQAPLKSRNPKRQKVETDGAADSPIPAPNQPTPSVVLPAARIKDTTIKVRAGSVPATREVKQEPAVKVEEGSEGIKGPAVERGGKFFVGAEVAYKQAKAREDGSQWIQCNITSFSGEGNKKRWAATMAKTCLECYC